MVHSGLTGPFWRGNKKLTPKGAKIQKCLNVLWGRKLGLILGIGQCVTLVEAQTPISAHLGTQRRGFSSVVYPGAEWSQHFFVAPFFFCLPLLLVLHTLLASASTQEYEKNTLVLITSKLFLQD